MEEQENIDVKGMVDSLRAQLDGVDFTAEGEIAEQYSELLCGLVLLAEGHLREQDGEWEISPLVREYLSVAHSMEGCEGCLDLIFNTAERLAQTLYERPRLKVRLLEFELKVLERMEAAEGKESELSGYLREDIRILKDNISYADSGRYDMIVTRGHLRHDPVEWTARWEEVIDAAEKEAYESLEGEPRGMGFCFGYWHAKTAALARYGISWRSPSIMNPGVIFD